MVVSAIHVSAAGSIVSQGSGITRYHTICGTIRLNTTEDFASQARIRSSLTARDLFVNVPTNTLNGTTTLSTRKNSGAGKLSVSVGSSTTGTFEDTTDTESLVSGDLYNISSATGGSSGTFSWTVQSVTLESSGNLIFVAITNGGSQDNGSDIGVGTATFNNLQGDNSVSGTEANSQVKSRTGATFSNLNVDVSANSLSTASTTVRFRKAGANGSQVVTISAGATGESEDTTNTDSPATGNLIDTSVTTAAGGTGTVRILKVSYQESSSANKYFWMNATAGNASSYNSAATRFFHLDGDTSSRNGSQEGQTQTKVRQSNVTISNLQAFLITNTINGTSTFTFRKNSAAGNQTTQFASSTTGFSEDTTDTDAAVPADLLDTQLVTLGSSGSETVAIGCHYLVLMTQYVSPAGVSVPGLPFNFPQGQADRLLPQG